MNMLLVLQGLSEEEVKAAAQCAGQEVMIRNTFSEMNAPRDNTSVNKYYNLAHAVSESVTKQPSLLRAGTLRDYQLVGCLLLTEVIFIFIVLMSCHRRFKIHFVGYLGGPTVDAFFVQ
jgi:hypothetical protein